MFQYRNISCLFVDEKYPTYIFLPEKRTETLDVQYITYIDSIDHEVFKKKLQNYIGLKYISWNWMVTNIVSISIIYYLPYKLFQKWIAKIHKGLSAKISHTRFDILSPHNHMRAIISCGFYIFYPIFEDHFFVFQGGSLRKFCSHVWLIFKSGF